MYAYVRVICVIIRSLFGCCGAAPPKTPPPVLSSWKTIPTIIPQFHREFSEFSSCKFEFHLLTSTLFFSRASKNFSIFPHGKFMVEFCRFRDSLRQNRFKFKWRVQRRCGGRVVATIAECTRCWKYCCSKIGTWKAISRRTCFQFLNLFSDLLSSFRLCRCYLSFSKTSDQEFNLKWLSRRLRVIFYDFPVSVCVASLFFSFLSIISLFPLLL